MSMDPISIGTSAGSWLWEKFGSDIIDKTVGAARKAWTKRSWKDREEQYKRRLIQLHSKTKLLGNPKEIKLDRIYTDVYVLDQISAFRRLRLDEKSKGLKESSGLPAKVKRFPLLDIVRERQRVYVLGKPGAGKSTFLKMVCLLCCTGQIERTPILIPLKQWNDSGLDLLDFMEREFDICEFPNGRPFVEHLLKGGGAILLLDGLDEIQLDRDGRQRAIATLSDFARKCATTQIVLTCRIAATEYSFDQFDYFEIADFTEQQQSQFIDKWYEDDALTNASFHRQWNLAENEGLRDLARTPLLLALLCLAFDETLAFPKRRVELYQEATNALLRKWDSSRGIRRDDLYKSLSHIRREQLLSRLASLTFFAGKVFFEKAAAVRIIDSYLSNLPPRDESRATDGEDVLRSIEAQHGLLVERAMGIYSFSHLTIQEYFTARNLVENAHSGVLRDKIYDKIFDDRWREVFLLVASLLDDADPFFSSIQELFNNKFFADAALLKLFRRAYEHSRVARSPAGRALKSARPPEQGSRAGGDATFAKAQDMCLSLASQFHYIKCGDSAAWRVRNVINYMDSVPPTPKSLFDDDGQAMASFLQYLRATNVVLESLQLASLTHRERVIDQLIFPVAGSSFGGL
jgi:predicted NACHT family NTPase